MASRSNGLNNLIIRISAGGVALISLFAFMIGPLAWLRVQNDIALDAKGPDWEIWVLILGGGIGAGVARFAHDLILRKFGRFSEAEIERNWSSRKKK